VCHFRKSESGSEAVTSTMTLSGASTRYWDWPTSTKPQAWRTSRQETRRTQIRQASMFQTFLILESGLSDPQVCRAFDEFSDARTHEYVESTPINLVLPSTLSERLSPAQTANLTAFVVQVYWADIPRCWWRLPYGHGNFWAKFQSPRCSLQLPAKDIVILSFLTG
jgi:hypothetical protein